MANSICVRGCSADGWYVEKPTSESSPLLCTSFTTPAMVSHWAVSRGPIWKRRPMASWPGQKRGAIGEAARFIGAGLGLGLLISFLVSQWLRGMFAVSPIDVWVSAYVIVILGAA